MTYHDFAQQANSALERDQQLALDNAFSDIIFYWTPILTWLCLLMYIIKKCANNPLSGPVADNILKRLIQRICYTFTRHYWYYQVPVFARDESRINVFLHLDFARLDRNNLTGYCNICNLYGHNNNERHTPTLDALVLAKTCNILRYNNKLNVPLAYSVHNIRAYEKNSRLFAEIFGDTTTNIPTRYALAPKKAVCDLTTIECNLGPIYVNNTIAYPHLGFIAYNNKQHLHELLANLSIVLENIMVYTQYEFAETSINMRKSNITLNFVNDFDLTNALTNELKDPRTPWLLKAKKASNKNSELEDDEAEKPATQNSPTKPKFRPESKLLQHATKKPTRKYPQLAFGPTFMTIACLIAIMCPVNSKICTDYSTAQQSAVYCNTVQNLTDSHYTAYANYEHLHSKCFSTDGENYMDLIRLSMSNALNLNNLIKPTVKEDYILKVFTRSLPLGTYVLSDYTTLRDLQVLVQYYNLDSEHILYTDDYSERADYSGKVVQLLAQGTGGSCDLPNCIRFTGLATTVTDVDVKVTERLTKRIKHQEHGKPLIIKPSCLSTCDCMIKEEPKIEIVKYTPLDSFYTQLRYFQLYELRIYDDFDMGVLRYNNYTLTHFIYTNETCILTHGKYCVYNTDHFLAKRVYNNLGNYLECGVNHEFCEALQQEFMYIEPLEAQVEPEDLTKRTPQLHENCQSIYNKLKAKYSLLDHIWTHVHVNLRAIWTRGAPATIVILHDSELVVKTVVEDIVHVAEVCLDNTAIRLNASDFNTELYTSDYHNFLLEYRPLLVKQKVMFINDIDLIHHNVSSSLFTIFDQYGPLVPDAFVIATLKHKRQKLQYAQSKVTPTEIVEKILNENWRTLKKDVREPLIVRITDTVLAVYADQINAPPPKIESVTPTLNNTSQVINTLIHYSTHMLNGMENHSFNAYSQVNTTVYNFIDYLYDAYDTTIYQLVTRYNNMLMAIYDIRNNFYNNYPLRQDFYHQSLRSFDAGHICDFLHHTDTIVLYQDCVKQELDTIYVIKHRYGTDGNAYHMHLLKTPFTKQSLYDLSNAVGFTYKNKNYNYYRTLFTNPGEYVSTIRENKMEFCKSSSTPTPVFGPDANLDCFSYITSIQFIDHFISEFGIFLALYGAAVALILAVAITIRDNTTVMLIKQAVIYIYAFGPWLLTPRVYGSYIFVTIYNFIPYTSNNSYGCLLMMGIIVIATIDVLSYLTQRYRADFTKNLLQLTTLTFELVAITYYILIPYLFTSYGIVLTIIAGYVAYYYIRSQRPNYMRASVTNAIAHADWVAYRNSTREKTDEAAKSNIRKIMNTSIADIKQEKLLECVYLAACYQATVATSTFNPQHSLHIPSYNTNIMFARDNEMMNHAVSTDLKNQSAASNPSISHIALELPAAINPLIKYTTRTCVSSLRGAIVNGYIYIQRHIFGGKQHEFDVCYANGKGLQKCKNLDRSKYDIDSAELIGTLIKIPLIDRHSIPDVRLHPDPLSYNGPVTLYLSRYDTELGKDVLCVHTGFMSEGHHDIKTVFGDCGGMLFDPKGNFLGLHCAGSEDVIFMDTTTGKSNIWTSYKLQHPSEIMITLDNKINLPNPKNYDFETSKVVYKHPLRNVKATLETLQHLTNTTNATIAYDPRLLSDFNITAEQYAHYGYNVDYTNFVNNFNRYTTTTIGTKSFETCLKYGLMDKRSEYHNQSVNPFNKPEVASKIDIILDAVYVFVYMFTHTHPAFYVAAVCVFALLFVKMNKYLKMLLSTIIFIIPHIYVNYYYGLLYMPVKWRQQITALAIRYNPHTAVAKFYNQDLKIAKDLSKELGTPKNLCTHLATMLKCIKPYTAFNDLSQVINNVDDLMANWANTHNAEELLTQYIDEIYKLYPILFVVFEKIDSFDEQLKIILSYISDTGEFDMNGFEIHFDEKEHTIKTTDTNIENIHEQLMVEKASIIALKNMNSEFDIETINNANIGELVRYLIISSTPETLDRPLLARATELLVRHITQLRENNEHNDNLIALLSEIYKHKDFLTASHLTSNLRDRNYVMNNLIRVIALFNKQINVQVTQKQYEARRIEEDRKKESRQILEQNNRIRKMQRQNQNIASAIVHMVHACFANRFMLQNESQKVMKALLGTGLELDPTEAEVNHNTAYLRGQVLTNKNITTNFTTLTTILWTGNGYQTLPSMCGAETYTCTATHKHGYFNCTMEIKDMWYKHTEECARCKSYYRNNKHPRCGALYDSTVKRFPTLSNFIARYRSCPSCMPCTQCISQREPGCESASYHVSDTAHYQNQAYLTPINIKPDNLEYNFVDSVNGDVNAIYNGRIWLMRRTTAINPPPARYRNITNLKLKQTDPEGYYYISDVCPTDLAILNAMINQIQLKLQDRTVLSNENVQEEFNNIMKFSSPLNPLTLDELRTKHKYLVILKLRPDSDHLLMEFLEYIRTANLPVFVVHLSHNDVHKDHATIYVNYLQAWRSELNDDTVILCDIIEKIIKRPLDFSQWARTLSRNSNVARYHQLCTNTNVGYRYTIDISCNKTSTSYVDEDNRTVNVKIKSSVAKEYKIYEMLISRYPNIFLIKHKMVHDTIPHLLRYNLTALSFADLYGLIKEENWHPIYDTLPQVTYHKIDPDLLFKIKQHTPSPQHTCCMLCRRFLAEFGLLLHKLNFKVYETTTNIYAHYEFVLTADNIDLNGILDFEDYILRKEVLVNIDVKQQLRMMQPYYHTLYSFYEHTGMYFISQPIYSSMVDPNVDLIQQFELAINNIRDLPLNGKFDDSPLHRPTIQHLTKYLKLNEYAMEPEPLWNSYDTMYCPQIEIPGIDSNITNIIIKPTRPIPEYIELDYNTVKTLEGAVYCKISHNEITNLQDILYNKPLDVIIHELYIVDHPYELESHNRMLRTSLNIWLHNLYDANVNLSHFDSINYDKTQKVSFPIIGTIPAKLLRDCELCQDEIPEDLKDVYDFGSCVHAKAQLLDYKTPRKLNPLIEFDTALLRHGEFQPNNDYAYTMKTKPAHIIDRELKDYIDSTGLTALIPPLNINPAVHDPETTYSSSYYIKTPSETSIRQDLELFNQNTAGSVSPTVFLMAIELLHQLLTEEISASDGKPNCPMVPSEVPVRNKHKSAGTPYRKFGDSEFMRELLGKYRDAIVYHKRHSADQQLTLTINKVAPSKNHRDRTILAISINKSEPGRSLYRWNLDKIKYTASLGGPILIGFTAQYGGWDKFYKHLYKNSPADQPDIAEHAVLGGKDYPKWDRRISNMLQLTTTTVLYSLIDPNTQTKLNNATPSQTWHEYMAETTQVLFDYLVFGNELYQKPGGVTSGNSRTADGNSLLHLLIDFYAIIIQLIQSTPDNVHLEQELRTNLCETVFKRIPSDYINTSSVTLRNTDVLRTIRLRVAKGLYLSDDGLVVIDPRIIRYDDFMSISHLISHYMIAQNKHKYHIDAISRYAREFLSQDTIKFGDMVYPIPEFGRMYTSMLLSDNKNILDPQINITRLLALFSYLYIYYFKYMDQPTHPILKFLDAIRNYIETKLHTTDEIFLDCVKVPDLQDVEFDLKNCDLYENLDYLWGLDQSSAYMDYLCKYKHRYRNLSIFKQQLIQQHETALLHNETRLQNKGKLITYNCYVCGENAYLTCATCERAFCNSADTNHGSHIEQHLQYSGHNCLYLNCRTVKCQHCYTTDINLLYTTGRDHYCESHKPKNAVRILNSNANAKLPPLLYLCVTEARRIPFYEQCYINYTKAHPLYAINKEQFMGLIQTYLHQDYTLPSNQLANRIRVSLQLSSYGVVRPYHQLIMQLTKLESKVLDSSVVDIPITLTNSQEIGTYYIEIPREHKLDQHSTYSYLIGTREVSFTPTYYRLSCTNTHIWQTDTQIPNYCTFIRQRRLNTLSAILRNTTQHVPEYTRLLLEWNQQLPITAKHFIEFKPSLKIPAQQNVTDNINILLNELNNKRFKIMFGGPGTGKSHTLSILINHLHEKGLKILVYTPSHQSANALLFKIANALKRRGVQNPGLVRIITDGMKDEIKPHPYITYRTNMLDKDRICVTTIQSFSTVQHVKDIDLVILDEFSLTSDNYLLTGLSHLKPSTRILFSGDPRQLSGVDELRKPLQSRFHTLINYYTETYPKEVHVLKYHFRCHPTIFKYFKDLYYADKDMECATSMADRIIRPLNPINTIQVGEPSYRQQGVILNKDETDKVLEILVLVNQTLTLHASYDYQPTIAIICSYKSQLQNFISLQQQKILSDNVQLSTIDSAQGDEFDIVILCLSQINNFTLNPNRFNVAISRAKSVLFITVPPIDQNPTFLYKDVYKTLNEHQLTYFKIFNNSGKAILSLDSPTTLKIQAENMKYINVRHNNPTMCRKFPINIVMDDYIFFDSEFLNPRDNVQEPVMLSYGFTSKYGKRRIAGIPVRYIQDKFNRIVPLKYNYKDPNKPLTSTYACDWLRKAQPEQYKHLLNSITQGIHNNTIVDIRHLLNFCVDNIHVKPVIVTWSGASDHCFLKAHTLYPDIDVICNITTRCTSQPIYASPQGKHTYYLCQYHAHQLKDQLNITHFVNLEIIDLKLDRNQYTDERTLKVYHNNNIKLILDIKNIASNSLKDCHSTYCRTVHAPIQPHDPLDDAIMTQCIFQSLVKPHLEKLAYETQANLRAFIGMEYRLKNFNPEMCKLRRELQKHWYKMYIERNIKHCNMGCGREPLKQALHNIDILHGKNNPQNNMNTHTCEAEEHIYFDSHWYKENGFTKPSYIFSDINKEHYYKLGTTGLQLYLNSKNAKYIHEFRNVDGDDVFRTFYNAICDLNRKPHNAEIEPSKSIPDCIITSNIGEQFQTLVCNIHEEELDIISKISQATKYGYKFIYTGKTLLNNHSNLTKAPLTWNHLDLEIPGYNERKNVPNHMKIKALGILQILQDSMLYTNHQKLNPKLPVILPGSASNYGDTVLANEMSKHLKQSNFIHIDPRLNLDNQTTHFRKTLGEMLDIGYNTELIISDIHNTSTLWVNELVEYANKYLLDNGTLIMKITSRGATEEALEQLENLSKNFTYVRVCNLNAVTLSSELWIVFANKRKPPVLGWTSHELRTELRRHWYSMSRNIIQPLMRARPSTFRYSPK
nr:polyprotein 1ab [Alphamesonivirus sp.]